MLLLVNSDKKFNIKKSELNIMKALVWFSISIMFVSFFITLIFHSEIVIAGCCQLPSKCEPMTNPSLCVNLGGGFSSDGICSGSKCLDCYCVSSLCSYGCFYTSSPSGLNYCPGKCSTTTSSSTTTSTRSPAPPSPPTTAPTTIRPGDPGSERCGNACTVCVLKYRDILEFYRSNGWDISCGKWDPIVDNWCTGVSDEAKQQCLSTKSNECRNECGVTSTTAPPSASTSSSSTSTSTSTSTVPTTTSTTAPQFTLECDETEIKVGEVAKCTVDLCNGGLWAIFNTENTPLDPIEHTPIENLPPKEMEIKPTKTDGEIKVLAICVDPLGMKSAVLEEVIEVSSDKTTTTSKTPSSTSTTTSSANELVCHFDNSFTCSGGETTDQEMLIDNFAEEEFWEENMMTGSVINGEYQGQLSSTFDPYMTRLVDFDEALNHLSMKYKGYPGGPKAIKIYYVDDNDCIEFDERCSQSFPITVTSDYLTLSLDMTDQEWADNDGSISMLKIDFESATDVGTIFLDTIKASSAGFVLGKKEEGILIKAGNTLTYPSMFNIDPKKGTIDFWVKPRWNGNDGLTHYFFDTGEATDSNRISIYKDSTNKLNFRILDASGNVNFASADISSWKAEEFHDIRVTWKTNEMQLYIDNNLVGTDMSVNAPTALGDYIFVGSSMNKVDQAEAIIDELVIGSSVAPPTVATSTSTSTTSSSTTTSLPEKEEFDIKDITCNENICTISINKNSMKNDVVVYVNLIHEPEGTIYYKGTANVDKGKLDNEVAILSNVRDCTRGTVLTLVATAYKIDNLTNRIDRMKSEAFEC